jgi:hypothetical protein
MKAGLSFQAEAEFKFGGGYKDDKLPYVAEDKFKVTNIILYDTSTYII